MNYDRNPHLAEIELRYVSQPAPEANVTILGPDEAYAHLLRLWNENTMDLREEFMVLLLNSDKRCFGWSKLSTGGKTAVIVEPSHVVSLAILSNAKSVVVAHNHPSGSLKPSVPDHRITQKLSKALALVDIQLEDHLIVTRNGYASMRELSPDDFRVPVTLD